jgi:hypothetical protein
MRRWRFFFADSTAYDKDAAHAARELQRNCHRRVRNHFKEHNAERGRTINDSNLKSPA